MIAIHANGHSNSNVSQLAQKNPIMPGFMTNVQRYTL